ncbi:hypothetical protein ACS0TY_024659 [Phlomoides rotata]
MRSWVLMFLLLLSILIHDAQGIRLRKGSLQLQALEQQSIHEKVSSNEGGIDECKSKKCSSGRIRKLNTMIHISSTTTTNAKNHGKNEDDQRKEETMDIAEMDYSLQARRKPPIHN